MKTITYDWDKVSNAVRDIAMSMYKDQWRPDYIIGVTRGGLVPAVMLSHMTDIPMHTLCVQLAANGLEENTESNCWMAEDAFGYEKDPKNILILDDINRGGDAMEWIMKDWQAGCLPTNEKWDQIWHNSVRFASLLSSPNSIVDTDYWSEELSEDENWVEFPWET
ncbi:phosphoribosyltransferase family protein [bacterium]|nr:phosphoribosyltransferase family protein [bacterium]